jgi:hypothetical protein
VKEEAKKKEMKKYNVKPPRDLRSKFELKQEAKREAEKQAEKERLRKEEEERIAVCLICQCTHYFLSYLSVYTSLPVLSVSVHITSCLICQCTRHFLSYLSVYTSLPI